MTILSAAFVSDMGRRVSVSSCYKRRTTVPPISRSMQVSVVPPVPRTLAPLCQFASIAGT